MSSGRKNRSSAMIKNGVRMIRKTISRYLAIVAIIALGSGFFTGLKVTHTAMIETGDIYLKDTAMYDAKVVSAIGWDRDDEKAFTEIDGVADAEAGITQDFLAVIGSNETVINAHSYSERINKAQLVSGRLPEKPDECLMDCYDLGGLDIGTVIKISERNDEQITDAFTCDEFTVVGTVRSPLYINFERGTTTLGNGSVEAFIILSEDSFNVNRYTDMYLKYDKTGYIYTEEYDDNVAAMEDAVLEKAESLSPQVMVLDRTLNVGYSCYKSDADIVDGIAAVFPLFFFAVAALVCLTTMNRMITDDRTQIGTLKSLGYSTPRIMWHYLFYAGSASVIGCTVGVILGSIIFPKTIWMAYSILYSMPDITLVFDIKLMLMSGASYLFLSLLVTFLTCRSELKEQAAQLIRPKSPAVGKRILLERVSFIWKRLKFLHKVSLRNVFRYRKRFIMMILGIGGCTALLLTGFGLNDSISHIADRQFKEITFYDAGVYFTPAIPGYEDYFAKEIEEVTDKCTFLYSSSVSCSHDGHNGTVTLLGVEGFDELDGMIDFHNGSEKVNPPGAGECIISRNLANTYDLHEGDDIELLEQEINPISMKIVGIYDNVIYNYVYTTIDTLKDQLDEVNHNLAYMNFNEGLDPYEASTTVSGVLGVTNVTLTDAVLERVNGMLDSMKYVVLLVICCAAALDFIVLFNLTNINILERIREIATIKVLGFRTGETSQYVFRENMILTLCGCVIGIPMGIALHNFVMSQIKIDLIAFTAERSVFTFVISIVMTFVFTIFVNLIMTRRLVSINMAEAMKSVE